MSFLDKMKVLMSQSQLKKEKKNMWNSQVLTF